MFCNMVASGYSPMVKGLLQLSEDTTGRLKSDTNGEAGVQHCEPNRKMVGNVRRRPKRGKTRHFANSVLRPHTKHNVKAGEMSVAKERSICIPGRHWKVKLELAITTCVTLVHHLFRSQSHRMGREPP